jgi:hypothetical protein
MTGGEMSGRLHTIDRQQEEARLSSAINGPWRVRVEDEEEEDVERAELGAL